MKSDILKASLYDYICTVFQAGEFEQWKYLISFLGLLHNFNLYLHFEKRFQQSTSCYLLNIFVTPFLLSHVL